MHAAIPGDGSAGNAAPTFRLVDMPGVGPLPIRAAFDGYVNQHLWWRFVCPEDYGSGGTVCLSWVSDATEGDCAWAAWVWAGADAEAVPMSAITVTATPVAGPGRVAETAITPAVDMRAGVRVRVVVFRDAVSGADTATPGAELLDEPGRPGVVWVYEKKPEKS